VFNQEKGGVGKTAMHMAYFLGKEVEKGFCFLMAPPKGVPANIEL
jgi:hypothetical protein